MSNIKHIWLIVEFAEFVELYGVHDCNSMQAIAINCIRMAFEMMACV
jgi:hypothetical protein